jgi:hypothetical protein
MFEFGTYTIASILLPRFIGIIYFISFGAFAFQIKGLLGSNGILPIKSYLEALKLYYGKKAIYFSPSIFWYKNNDSFLLFIMYIASLMGLCLAFSPWPLLSSVLLFILCILQLSLLNVGQSFLGFGWELYMIQITIGTFFLSFTSPPNFLNLISLNLLLFAIHFEAGVSKLKSRDINWRNLTAVSYHYQSQPIPNTLAWYMHKLPTSIHKLSCVYLFFVELIAPFGMVFGEDIRFITFLLFASLQIFIYLTGNFSYLNHLTLFFSTLLISDKYFGYLLHKPKPWGGFILGLVAGIFGLFLIFIQAASIFNYLSKNKKLFTRLLNLLDPFHIVSYHGIFAVMTTKRLEIVIEGSLDGENWKEYLFYFKPTLLTKRPKRNSPYQPRLDWMMWFLPFSPWSSNHWFQNFETKLLEANPDVLKLLEYNPFEYSKPKFIRALIYDYSFSDFESKKKKKQWWNRTFLGFYGPILHLPKKNNN